jgi:hypothetical protein
MHALPWWIYSRGWSSDLLASISFSMRIVISESVLSCNVAFSQSSIWIRPVSPVEILSPILNFLLPTSLVLRSSCCNHTGEFHAVIVAMPGDAIAQLMPMKLMTTSRFRNLICIGLVPGLWPKVNRIIPILSNGRYSVMNLSFQGGSRLPDRQSADLTIKCWSLCKRVRISGWSKTRVVSYCRDSRCAGAYVLVVESFYN